LGPVSWV